MNNQTFVGIASALSVTISSALAGIALLPIDDGYKAVAVFILGLVGTFLAALIKPPTGPTVSTGSDTSSSSAP